MLNTEDSARAATVKQCLFVKEHIVLIVSIRALHLLLQRDHKDTLAS